MSIATGILPHSHPSRRASPHRDQRDLTASLVERFCLVAQKSSMTLPHDVFISSKRIHVFVTFQGKLCSVNMSPLEWADCLKSLPHCFKPFALFPTSTWSPQRQREQMLVEHRPRPTVGSFSRAVVATSRSRHCGYDFMDLFHLFLTHCNDPPHGSRTSLSNVQRTFDNAPPPASDPSHFRAQMFHKTCSSLFEKSAYQPLHVLRERLLSDACVVCPHYLVLMISL